MKLVAPLSELLQGKRLLIFDFDGTVADTSPLHAAAFLQVLAPYGIKLDYPQIAGMKTSDALRKCFSVTGQSIEDTALVALVAAKQQCVRNMISMDLNPLPGMDAFLIWARQRYQLAMVTSGSRHTVTLALEKLGFEDWFNPLICAEDVQHSKPHPEGFLTVMSRTGQFAEQTLVFEDSAAGFAAAAAAKLDCYDVGAGLLLD
jgi:HAD superfamily hydrolase (TIGR01509 family)